MTVVGDSREDRTLGTASRDSGDEADLTARLILAAAVSAEPLTQEQVDRLLGL